MSAPIARTFIRSARAVPKTSSIARRQALQKRFNSVNANQQPAAGGIPQGVVGGLIGAGAVIGAGYGYYHYSGAKQIVDTARQSKAYLDKATSSLKNVAPEPNQALEWLHEQANHYASFVPGGKSYVDSAFKGLDSIREKHGDEVNELVQKAYKDLSGVSKSQGFSLEAASKSYEILQNTLTELGKLAGDAAGDILENHPEIKEKVGGSLDQLKQLGDKFGPDAKKQVDETMSQVKAALAGGLSLGTVNKIRKLIQDKSESVKQLGEQAWSKGLEEAKPYLEKTPEIKKLVEDNADVLKSGNLAKLFTTLSSGKTDDIKKYISSTVEQGKDAAQSAASGTGFEKYLSAIPGSSEIIPKIKQLNDISQKHGKEAEQLLKETWEEVENVLKKKLEQGQKLGEKAGKEVKNEAKK